MNFPFFLETVDVTFQNANWPPENMQEGKVHFSGKHMLYGYRNRLSSIRDDAKRKRYEIQATYIPYRWMRLSIGYDSNVLSIYQTVKEE